MDPTIIGIENNAQYGRYLIALKNIKEGELILKEQALFIGSQIDAFHICFRCNNPLKVRIQICKDCKVATLCSNNCEGIYHKDLECIALKNSGLKAINIINIPEVILPLRCLLVKKYDQNLWTQLMLLEAHLDKRRNTTIWNSHKHFIEEPLKSLNMLTKQDLEQEIIQRICGILDINTFEVRSLSSNEMSDVICHLRGLYLQASLMTHDCVGNTLLSVDDDFTMTIYASKSIAAREAIFFNYSDCLKGTFERRLHLREGKYFECNCKRCSDPTELNTHMSSIRCNKCKNGLVAPTLPLFDIYTSPWSCRQCSTLHDGACIKLIFNEAINKISCLDMADTSQAEDVLKELESYLSSQHYLILELKQNIIPTYLRTLYNDWSMIRITQLCEDIISVLKIIQPGLSRLRGIALYQLQSAQMALANKRYQCKEITSFNYLPLLIEAQENLTTAIKYLLYEPKNSPEGRLTQCALNDLKILRNTTKQIKAICDSKLSGKHDILHNLMIQNKNY